MDRKTEIKVNMTGKEYMEYRESRNKPLSKSMKNAMPYFILSGMGGIILLFFLTRADSSTDSFGAWHNAFPVLINASWSEILKFTMMYFAPFIIIVVGIAWVFHGVGFALVRGR